MKRLLAGLALFLCVLILTESGAATADVAWRGRSHRSHARQSFFTRRYSSPGYEYRYRRNEARSAAGYNRVFGI